MEKARAHVIVEGRVQGVFFRYHTEQMARSLGVSGWVRNRLDGTVEAIFEGDRDKVQKMIDWCHKGPSGARVAGVRCKWEPYTGEFDGFSIYY